MGGEGVRGVHFVGTYPASDAETAMIEMLRETEGLPRIAQPDGETQDRKMWIARTAEALQDSPDLEVAQVGDNSDYEHTWRHRVKPGAKLTPDSLRLDYAQFVPGSYEIWKDLRAFFEGTGGVPLQVGVPHALDHALFILEDGVPNHMDVVNEAISEQITKAHGVVGSDGVIQLESPAALTLAMTPDDILPSFLQRGAVGESFAVLAEEAPEGTRFGIHLCLGDLNNKTQSDLPLTSGEAVVGVSQAIVDAWPDDKPLEYIHFPIAGGDKPPTEAPELYRELGKLAGVVPERTQIIAGLAHESQDLETQQRLLRRLETALDGRQVYVAAACGIARRREGAHKAARSLMHRMRDLATS